MNFTCNLHKICIIMLEKMQGILGVNNLACYRFLKDKYPSFFKNSTSAANVHLLNSHSLEV
jgi:hypothetical protein